MSNEDLKGLLVFKRSNKCWHSVRNACRTYKIYYLKLGGDLG